MDVVITYTCFVLSDGDDDDTNKNDTGLKFSLMLEGQLDA